MSKTRQQSSKDVRSHFIFSSQAKTLDFFDRQIVLCSCFSIATGVKAIVASFVESTKSSEVTYGIDLINSGFARFR